MKSHFLMGIHRLARRYLYIRSAPDIFLRDRIRFSYIRNYIPLTVEILIKKNQLTWNRTRYWQNHFGAVIFADSDKIISIQIASTGGNGLIFVHIIRRWSCDI